MNVPVVTTHGAFSTRPRRRSSLAEKVDAASVLASLCLASAKKSRVACASPPTSVRSPTATKRFLNVNVSNHQLDESYIEHVLSGGSIAEEKITRSRRTIEDYAQQSFPETLMEILSNEHDSICWLSNNRGFIIKNKDKFADDVLPRYFKGSKYSSFTRKLKRWGFSRLPGAAAAGSTVYAHDKFRRDEPVLMVQLNCTSYSRPKKSSEAQAALNTSMKRPSAESSDSICSRETVDSRELFLEGPCLSVANPSNYLVPPGFNATGPRQFSVGSYPQVANELRLPREHVPTSAQSFLVRTGVPLSSYQPVRGRGRTGSLRQQQQLRKSYQSDLILTDRDVPLIQQRRSLPGVLDDFSNNQPAFDSRRSLSSDHLQLDREVRRLITSSSSRNHQFIIEGAASALTANHERHQEAHALRLELEGCRDELRNIQKGLFTFNRLNTR